MSNRISVAGLPNTTVSICPVNIVVEEMKDVTWMVVEPVLVTVDAPKTSKLCAEPSTDGPANPVDEPYRSMANIARIMTLLFIVNLPSDIYIFKDFLQASRRL